MTGSQQPSDVRFVVQRGDSSVDADLELIHGLTSQDIIDAVADARSGTSAAANPAVANVVRDASGRVTSWTEDGIAGSVTRDASGLVVTVTWNGTTRTIARDSNRRVTGVA